MKVSVLGFGIVKEIFGIPSIDMELPSDITTVGLKEILLKEYPDLLKLSSFMIAVNNSYAQKEQVITSSDEIAIIPPVSGG